MLVVPFTYKTHLHLEQDINLAFIFYTDLMISSAYGWAF